MKYILLFLFCLSCSSSAENIIGFDVGKTLKITKDMQLLENVKKASHVEKLYSLKKVKFFDSAQFSVDKNGILLAISFQKKYSPDKLNVINSIKGDYRAIVKTVSARFGKVETFPASSAETQAAFWIKLESQIPNQYITRKHMIFVQSITPKSSTLDKIILMVANNPNDVQGDWSFDLVYTGKALGLSKKNEDNTKGF